MTMRIETKSAVILSVTLLLGILIGLLTAGAIAQKRQSQIAELREHGIAIHIERIVEPRDDAQREAIRAVLEDIGQRNFAVMRGARAQIRENLEELRKRLDPLLDDEQRERLESAADRFPRGPGFGPRPGFDGPPGGRRDRRHSGRADSAWGATDSVGLPIDSDTLP